MMDAIAKIDAALQIVEDHPSTFAPLPCPHELRDRRHNALIDEHREYRVLAAKEKLPHRRWPQPRRGIEYRQRSYYLGFGTCFALAALFFFWFAALAFTCFCAACLCAAFGDLSPMIRRIRSLTNGVNPDARIATNL